MVPRPLCCLQHALGLEALTAKADLVVIDGRIMTHLITLTPDSVRQLQAARDYGLTRD